MSGAAWDSWLPDWADVDTGSMTLIIGWETSSHHVQVRWLPIGRSVANDLTQPITETSARLVACTPTAYSPDLELDDDQYAIVVRDQLDPASSLLRGLEALTPPEGTTD